MIDALVGGVIMVVATTSLLYSIEVAEKAINQAGKYDPSSSEQRLLDDFELGGADDKFWKENIKKSWDHWGKR